MKEFFNSIGNWFLSNWEPIAKTLVIIILGVFTIKIILAIVKRQLLKTNLEKTAQAFIGSILKFVLYLILIFSILGSLGISLTGLTVIVTAVSLAISLALQDSLKNLVNGFVIISNKMIKQGDWVKIGDAEGSVIDVRMLYTTLKSIDGRKIMIPNSSVISKEVINFNVYKTRRIDIVFPISYNSDVDRAKQIISKVVKTCEMVLEEPEPIIAFSGLGESNLKILARFWCQSPDYFKVQFYIIDNAFNELKREGFNIGLNQLEVALVEKNVKPYVRQEKLPEGKNRKKFVLQDEDIITKINKKLKNSEVHLIRDKIKRKRLAKTQKTESKTNKELPPKDAKKKEEK